MFVSKEGEVIYACHNNTAVMSCGRYNTLVLTEEMKRTRSNWPLTERSPSLTECPSARNQPNQTGPQLHLERGVSALSHRREHTKSHCGCTNSYLGLNTKRSPPAVTLWFSPPDVGSKIKLEHILYKVGVGTRCGEGKRHPDDGPDNYCAFPWAEMVVEDL